MKQYLSTNKLPIICTALISLFFILVLHIKLGYTLLPLLLSVIGIRLLFPNLKPSKWQLDHTDKGILIAFFFYFFLVLVSVWFHQGKGRELDLPSKLLLMLPLLAVCYRVILKPLWILWAIIVGTLLAGVVGIIRFYTTEQIGLFPVHMYIQAGGILMTLSLCCMVIAFYFQQQKQWRGYYVSLIATVLGGIVCLLNQARGAWLFSPIVLLMILYWHRHLLSKWLVIGFMIIGVVGGLFAGNLVQKRWQQAEHEITQYFEHHNGSTSVGARLDMWKSAIIGIQEKPLFGHGVEGVKALRQTHYQQGIISQFAASFVHAHNQYLHDAGVRGLLGLIALLGIFLTPLYAFWKNSRHAAKDSLVRVWGILGSVHILSMMGYCLTQSFLAHNSGMMFYGFLTLLFYGLQKSELKQPLIEERKC